MSNALTTLDQLRSAASQSSNATAKVASAAAAALEEMHGLKADRATFVSFSIPITGWKTDSSVPGYTKYIDIQIDELTSADSVSVDVDPASSAVAIAAGFTSTESLDGTLRLRAALIPTAVISAQYHIIEAASAAKEV